MQQDKCKCKKFGCVSVKNLRAQVRVGFWVYMYSLVINSSIYPLTHSLILIFFPLKKNQNRSFFDSANFLRTKNRWFKYTRTTQVSTLTSNNSVLQQPLHHTDFARRPPKPNSDHHEFNDDVSGVWKWTFNVTKKLT